MADLRAVKPGEKPPITRPKTVTQAAQGGTTRELLIALRDRIARTLEDPNCPPRDLASNSKRLMEIVRDIEAIDARAHEEAKESVATADEAWDSEAL